MTQRVPHMVVIVAFCVFAVCGYAALSAYIMLVDGDPALKGDVVGTWKSFAVLAFGFWIGSSSGGKQRDVTPPVESPPI